MAPGKRTSSRKTQNTSIMSAPSTINNMHSIQGNDSYTTTAALDNESSPPSDNSNLAHPFAPMSETATIDLNSTKCRRGPNRGVELEELYRTKGKISILIPEGLNRPVGEHHSKLSREAGIIIRNFAPMQVERWEKISDTDKDMLIKKLMVKMNITIDKAHVKECVMYTLRKRFSDFRSKAHTYCKKLGGGNMARQKPFKELSERLEDWLWLCDYFESDTFKKKSESNSQNRSKLKFVHRMGTRSLVAHQYDQDNMIEIRQKVINEGATPDEAIICAEVLGETSSYIRGLGYGPKPIKKYKFVRSNEPSEREVELESNLKDIQEKFEEQSKIIKTQQKSIDWLKAIAKKMGMQPPIDDGSDFSNEDNDK